MHIATFLANVRCSYMGAFSRCKPRANGSMWNTVRQMGIDNITAYGIVIHTGRQTKRVNVVLTQQLLATVHSSYDKRAPDRTKSKRRQLFAKTTAACG